MKRDVFGLPPVLRNAFSPTDDFPGLECKDVSLTKQADADDADINVIVGRFGLGPHDPIPVVLPSWENQAVESMTFQDAMNIVVAGREAFDMQPASIRTEFDNNPMKFADFLANDRNRSRAEEMGLLAPKVGVQGPTPAVAPSGPQAPPGEQPPAKPGTVST